MNDRAKKLVAMVLGLVILGTAVFSGGADFVFASVSGNDDAAISSAYPAEDVISGNLITIEEGTIEDNALITEENIDGTESDVSGVTEENDFSALGGNDDIANGDTAKDEAVCSPETEDVTGSDVLYEYQNEGYVKTTIVPDTSEEMLIYFSDSAGSMMRAARAASITLVRGAAYTYPSYWGSRRGSHRFTLDGQIAFCANPQEAEPGDGTYPSAYGTVSTTTDETVLRVLSYGYGGANDCTAAYLNSIGRTATDDARYALTHIAIAVAFGDSNPYYKANDACRSDVTGFINYIKAFRFNTSGMYAQYVDVTGMQSIIRIVGDKVQTVDLTITKRSTTDLSGNRGYIYVKGAVFELWGWNGTSSGYTKRIGAFTDNGNGTYTIKGISASQGDGGHFLVKEVSAAPGYSTTYYAFNSQDATDRDGWGGRQFLLSNGTWTCHTLTDYTYPSWGFTFLDYPNTTNFKVTKVDADTGEKLTDAEFALYGWNAATDKYDIAIGKFTDNGDGTYTSPTFSIDMGDNRKYLVKETKAPENYYLSSADSTDLDFKTYGGRQVILNVDGTVSGSPDLTFENKQMNGTIKLKKVSALPAVTDNNSCYLLEGAEYGVYQDSVCETLVGMLVTDAEGNSNELSMKYGTYYVKEITASTGYELDGTVYTVVVEAGKTVYVNAEGGEVVAEYPGNNQMGIQITKVPNGEETPTIPTLEGTQFTIRYYDGYYTQSDLPDTATRTWVVETKKEPDGTCVTGLADSYIVETLSDELYYDGSMVILPYGTITIQETKPAAGYTLNGYLADSEGNVVSYDGALYAAQITKDIGAVKVSGGNEYSACDTPISGSIRIKKYDADGRTALQGVTFELISSAGEVLASKTTDDNGEILFDDLYPDVYTIMETKTVSGHTLLKDPITAVIPMRVTEQDISDNNIDKSQCIYDEADDIYYIHNLTYEIGNSVTFEFPMTGGFTGVRTFVPLGFGMAVIIGMSAVFLKRKCIV